MSSQRALSAPGATLTHISEMSKDRETIIIRKKIQSGPAIDKLSAARLTLKSNSRGMCVYKPWGWAGKTLLSPSLGSRCATSYMFCYGRVSASTCSLKIKKFRR